MKKSLAVVIVNWNGREMLARCLESLRKQTYSDFKVYVVDNGSTDGSVEMIKKDYPETSLTKLDKNYGFAEPNNIGMRKAFLENGEILKYICPLNNDIEVEANYLQELVTAAQGYEKQDIKVGVLATKLMFYYEKGLINTTGTVVYPDGSGMERGFKEEDKGQYEKPMEVFGSCAGAALYSSKMLKEIAYKNSKGEDCFFDGDFFAYYEDLDLNYRSRLCGYRAFYVPTAVGHHVHSATGKSYSAFKSFHVHRNQYYVLIKNYPLPYLIMGLALMVRRYIMLFSSMLFKKRGPSSELSKNTGKAGVVGIVFKSWKEIFFSLPSLIRKRREIQRKRKVTLSQFGSWFRNPTFKAELKKMIYG